MAGVTGPFVPCYGFDLTDTPEAERERAWRKVSGRHFELQDLPASIEARGRACDFGRAVLTDMLHPRCTAVRSRERARRDAADHVLVAVPLQTPSGEDAPSVRRAILLDLTRPVTKVVEAGRTLCLTVARDLIDAALPNVDLHELTLGAGGALMTEHLQSLSSHLPQTELAAAPLLLQSTVQMLAACVSPTADRIEQARPALTQALVQRAQRYVLAHRHDPRLSPDQVALGVGASRTSLYRAFRPEGGIAEFIRASRLDAARRALSDPGDGRRISEIAFAYGFSSEAQFSRAMRAAYGASPGELRRRPHGFGPGLSPEDWARCGWVPAPTVCTAVLTAQPAEARGSADLS
jgi:AraC-like DNA-binding protein